MRRAELDVDDVLRRGAFRGGRGGPGCSRAGFLDVERAASAAVESLEEVADVADDPAVRVPATDEDRPCTGVRRRASPARGRRLP